jgi:glutamate-5-semialdehyde dehydrogenase
LASLPPLPAWGPARQLGGGLQVRERLVPVGVIGANYEARPAVTLDIASQLLKSRNAGVLRSGAAALRSAAALTDLVVAPALEQAELDPRALQLIRTPDRAAARARLAARARPARDPARQR